MSAERRAERKPAPVQGLPRLRRTREPSALDFTIITGLSGAGRSEAAKCLEDLGYFVVDNLPPALIGKMAELAVKSGEPSRVAIVADVRGGAFFDDLASGLRELQDKRVPYRILFLEASDDVLVRRFAATRRRHPLTRGDRMVEGLREERTLMEALREQADLVIDTSDLTPHQLRDRIREAFTTAAADAGLQVALTSFGYKFGVPRDADLVIDVRFLPNPHWVDELRPLPGTSDRVRRYVEGQDDYEPFMGRLTALLDHVVPGYVREGKHYLMVAVGCTGGRHRSVVVVDELSDWFRARGLPATVEHRDLDRS